MTIALLSVTVRHERRVRLSFSVAIAAGAFTSPSLYTVTSLDGTAIAPTVTRALAVANAPQSVELQLGGDLVQGSLYSFSAVGVPGTDATVTPSPSTASVLVARETRAAALGARGAPSAYEETLYGRDVRWSGTDFGETPAGDLDTVAGIECVSLDLTARLVGGPLPWDPSYGLNTDEYVDAPSAGLGKIRGAVIAQLRADDRVANATASVDASDPEEPVISALPVLVGDSLFGASLTLRAPL